MFYDINKFPALKVIQDNCSVINQELTEAIERDDKVRLIMNPDDIGVEHYTEFWAKENGFHRDQLGYDIRKGEYAAMAIFKKGFPIKHFNVEELFPRTTELLKTVENLEYSAIFKMYPKTKVDSHTHLRSHLIFHLLLNDLENGDYYLRCKDESKRIKSKGDYMIFDYSNEHESENSSDSDRYHLIIDFNPNNRSF